jgi:tetratricopeptide (TPR) repeat protein
MSIWTRVAIMTAAAFVAAILLAYIPAGFLDQLSDGNERRFIQSMVPASLVYIFIALNFRNQFHRRVLFDRLALLYTYIWPVVGILALIAADTINSREAGLNPSRAAIAAIVSTCHPVFSFLLAWLAFKRTNLFTTTFVHSKTRGNPDEVHRSGSLRLSANKSSENLDLSDQIDNATSEKFDLLIKYSHEVRAHYDRLENLPRKLAIQFKKQLAASESPRTDARAIADRLIAEHAKERAPFDDVIANSHLQTLRDQFGEKAASEFVNAMMAFGVDADANAIFKKLTDSILESERVSKAKEPPFWSPAAYKILVISSLVVSSIAAYWYSLKPPQNDFPAVDIIYSADAPKSDTTGDDKLYEILEGAAERVVSSSEPAIPSSNNQTKKDTQKQLRTCLTGDLMNSPNELLAACTSAIQSGQLEDADSVRALVARAALHEEFGANNDAMSDVNEAIKLNRHDPGARYARGLLKLKEGLDREAVQDFSAAIMLNPSNGYAYNERGKAYTRLKQYDLAIRDFDEAIKLMPHWEAVAQNKRIAVYAKNYQSTGQGN